MRSRKGLPLALAVTTACASVPAPHGPVPLEPGQRVRVALASRVVTGPLQGDVVSVAPDSLVVAREEGGERRLSRTQIAAVEVSVARTSEPEKAAGYGILAGAPLLIPLLLIVPLIASEYGTAAYGVILVPVAVLAAVGAAIGSGAQDVWVDAAWPSDTLPARPDTLSAEGA